MEILYEDKNIVVVNKPIGILSVPYEGFKGKTMLGQLTEYYRKRGMIRAGFCPKAVHRLDKETSGVMIFALNEKSKNQLMNNWKTSIKSRMYIALAENPKVQAKLLPQNGVIDLPLTKNAYHHSFVARDVQKLRANNAAQNRLQNVQNRPQSTQNAHSSQNVQNRPQSTQNAHSSQNVQNRPQNVQSAITHYDVLQQGKNFTLFALELETGRTNQIRAHLSSIGYTIAGDTLFRAKTNPCNRLCLHAKTIEFIHPETNEKMQFSVPEPPLWQKLAQ